FDGDSNTAENTRSFYHLNALGSVTRIIGMNQAEGVKYRDTRYGEVTITPNNTTYGADPLDRHWPYQGISYDGESATYLRAREYPSTNGRPLPRDPFGLHDASFHKF